MSFPCHGLPLHNFTISVDSRLRAVEQHQWFATGWDLLMHLEAVYRSVVSLGAIALVSFSFVCGTRLLGLRNCRAGTHRCNCHEHLGGGEHAKIPFPLRRAIPGSVDLNLRSYHRKHQPGGDLR
jgi:hypothetical protein